MSHRGPTLGFVFEDHAFEQRLDDFLLFGRELGDGFKLEAEIGIWTTLIGASRTNPKGNITSASFADNFGNGSNPDAGSSGTNGLAYAFSTLITNSLGHQVKAQFDYTRGLQTGAKDANQVIAKTEYDLMGRPTRQTVALGLAEQAISEISYPTASSNSATISKQLDATRWLSTNGGSSGSSGPQGQWLITDHLGTPRLIIDQTGSLANVKRHDYLPFGEELHSQQGLRTEGLGYVGGEGVRDSLREKRVLRDQE